MKARALLVAASLIGLVACSDDGDSAIAPEETATTTVPTRVIEDPFCDTMVDLRAAALAGELPDDPDYVLNTYLDLIPYVPAGIAADFRQMIQEIETGVSVTDATLAPSVGSNPTGATTPETTSEAAVAPSSSAATTPEQSVPVASGVIESEGYVPDPTAIERVQAFVASNCTATANNPGPPATVPP